MVVIRVRLERKISAMHGGELFVRRFFYAIKRFPYDTGLVPAIPRREL